MCVWNRKQYRKLLQCIVLIQKNYRAFYWRRKFLVLRWAALTFQKQVRGQRARRACRQLQEERRRRRREEEEQEEERRRRKQQLEEEQERERWVCSDCLFPGNPSTSVVWPTAPPPGPHFISIYYLFTSSVVSQCSDGPLPHLASLCLEPPNVT